jgi:signal transduction histidine kinase
MQVMMTQFARMGFEHAYETAMVQPGFGLGLAFCKLATDAMNGRIWVNSELGRGSTFCVAFPCQEEPVHEK